MANKSSKAAAEVAGKTKAAGKAMKGEVGVLKHLAGEHGKAASLMQRIAKSSEDSDARQKGFDELKIELLAHAKAEEKVFYPALKKHPELSDLVAKSLDQHQKVEQKLEKLSSGNRSTKTWHQEFERMKNAVEQHVELEEKQIFPLAKDLFTKDQLEELEERYEAQEEQIKARLG